MEPVTKLRVSDDEDVLDRYRDEMKEIRRNAFPPVYEESDNGHEATIVIGSDKYEVQLYENRYRKVGADQ
jgi:hypothetical protein